MEKPSQLLKHPDLYALGNRASTTLLLQVLQTHLHSTTTGHTLLPQAQAEGHLSRDDRLVGGAPRVQEALGLKRLPHFTTVQKEIQRLSTTIWRVLQRLSSSLVEGGWGGGPGLHSLGSLPCQPLLHPKGQAQDPSAQDYAPCGYSGPDGPGPPSYHHSQARHPDRAEAHRKEPGAVPDPDSGQGLRRSGPSPETPILGEAPSDQASGAGALP